MLCRTSHVRRIILKNVASSSNFHIGDTHYIDSTADILGALQNSNIFTPAIANGCEKETNHAYKAPCPSIDETIKMTRFNAIPKICVNNINVIALSAASTFQIGNTEHIRNATSIYFKIINQLPVLKGE